MNSSSQKAYSNYYLYTDDLESVIKTCIWWVSAIGGIWTQQFADARARGGAFFIFALSLMMEFAPKLKEKSGFVARAVHLVFLIAIIVILSLSFAFLFGAKLPDKCDDLLTLLLIVVIAFISVNCIGCCLGIIELFDKSSKPKGNGSENDVASIPQEVIVFNEKAELHDEKDEQAESLDETNENMTSLK